MSSNPSASPARGDAWLSAILFAGFLAAVVAAIDYPPAARAVPLLVGVLGAALTAVQFVRTLRGLRLSSGPTRPTFSSGHVVMFCWLIGAAALVAAFGVLVGGGAFVTAFLCVRLREPWPSAFQAGLALSAVLHLVLERGLGVYLFEGLVWQ